LDRPLCCSFPWTKCCYLCLHISGTMRISSIFPITHSGRYFIYCTECKHVPVLEIFQNLICAVHFMSHIVLFDYCLSYLITLWTAIDDVGCVYECIIIYSSSKPKAVGSHSLYSDIHGVLHIHMNCLKMAKNNRQNTLQ